MTQPPDPFARWPDLDALFSEVVEKTPAERAVFLEGIGARDADLRRELEKLLAAPTEAGGFLDNPLDWFGSLAGEPAGVNRASQWLGRTVDQYEILERLGAGGMGVAYRARDTKLNRQATLKFLRPHMEAVPGSALRFLNEAASALEHPNICTIHEIGEGPGGEPYMDVVWLVRKHRADPRAAAALAELGLEGT